MNLIFEWNANKAIDNVRKHKVSFDEAKTIFNDPYLVTYPDEVHSASEERLISIGHSRHNKILIAVHTDRQKTEAGLVVRIISCRRATPKERKFYEEE